MLSAGCSREEELKLCMSLQTVGKFKEFAENIHTAYYKISLYEEAAATRNIILRLLERRRIKILYESQMSDKYKEFAENSEDDEISWYEDAASIISS